MIIGGIPMFLGGAKPPVLTFLASSTSNPATLSFGAESSDRFLIVSLATDTGNVDTLSGTIGGISATVVIKAQGAQTLTGILIALVPTGTSGSVSLTVNSWRGVIALYSVTNLASPTAFHTNSTINTEPHSTSINIPTNGIALASAGLSSGGSYTWTGLTERYDVDVSGQTLCSGASLSFVAAETSRSVVANSTATDTRGSIVVASWGN